MPSLALAAGTLRCRHHCPGWWAVVQMDQEPASARTVSCVSSGSLGCGSIGIRQAARLQEHATELGVAASAPTLLRLLLFPAIPIKGLDHAHCLHLLLYPLGLPSVSKLPQLPRSLPLFPDELLRGVD